MTFPNVDGVKFLTTTLAVVALAKMLTHYVVYWQAISPIQM